MIRRWLVVACLALALVASRRAPAQEKSGLDDEETSPEGLIALVAKGDLDRAVAAAASGTRSAVALGTDRVRRYELVGAVARAVRFARTRSDDRAAVERAIDRASVRALAADLPFLKRLGGAAQDAAPYVRVLERAAYRSIAELEDEHVLVTLAQDEDPESRRRAVEALAARLAVLRRKVDEGGTLDPREQARLVDRGVIDALVARLGERGRGGDALSPDLAAGAGEGASRAVGATALHALALIETPALPALESAARGGSADATAALRAVRAAIEARLRRAPGSTWASAKGQAPSVALASLPCGQCGKPLPPVGKACPSCGRASEGPGCARCGVPLRDGTFCAICGGGPLGPADARACPGCGDEAALDARFCKRCGADRTKRPKKG